jgi:hypothetical protein
MSVMDKSMKSTDFIDFIVNQLPNEPEERILMTGLMQLRALINQYLPVELVAEKKAALFDAIYGVLMKGTATLEPMADQLFGFISTEEQISKAIEWLKSGKIEDEGRVILELKPKHKHSVLKKYFTLKDVADKNKFEMLELVMGDDKSDIAENVRLTCKAYLPNAAGKEETWKALIDINSTESLKERSAKMAGFHSWNQLDITRCYFDKFYDELRNIQAGTPFKYQEAFFYSLLPRYEISDAHIVKLVQLKNETPDNQATFANMLQDGIELLIRSKQVRAHALS